MTVEPARHTTWLLEAFLKAGQLAGYSLHDPNSFEAANGRQESFSPYLFNIKDGKRWTTADAYLRPAIAARGNLNVALNAHVRKLIFNSQKKVTGVEFTQNSGYTIMEVRNNSVEMPF